jgi:CelD/BcsL family acetyltransferase involved in cellulose biosynthesis
LTFAPSQSRVRANGRAPSRRTYPFKFSASSARSKPNGGNSSALPNCTAFQTFDWLATWQNHVGERRGARPVIAVGRFAEGDVAFIVPLCLMRGHLARRLCWLGQDLSDYNAPLLAADFSERTTPEDFLAAWHELQMQMQCEPLLRHDWIEFEKMPETVRAQANPFMHLRVTPNRSNAHLAHLSEDWEKFYCAKRSSATRRRDRSKPGTCRNSATFASSPLPMRKTRAARSKS